MNLLKVFQSGLYPAQLNSVVLPSSSSSSSFKTEFLVAQASLDSPLPSPSTQVSASPRSQSPEEGQETLLAGIDDLSGKVHDDLSFSGMILLTCLFADLLRKQNLLGLSAKKLHVRV